MDKLLLMRTNFDMDVKTKSCPETSFMIPSAAAPTQGSGKHCTRHTGTCHRASESAIHSLHRTGL